MSATVGVCPKCGDSRALLMPLHGDKGGPTMCMRCGADWHGKWGRRRKLGRIVVKSMKAYFAAGGAWGDIDRLKLAAAGCSIHQWDGDTLGADVGDITTELLEATIRLTHPDKHPPERKEVAQQVTAELIALKPFTFPAPKKEPPPTSPPPPRNESFKLPRAPEMKPLRIEYPCETCADQVPYYYCDTCKAEWSRRNAEEWERDRQKQRARYKRRRDRLLYKRGAAKCSVCSAEFKSKRPDARYCSAACRQQAHRNRVTLKKTSQPATLNICYAAGAP